MGQQYRTKRRPISATITENNVFTFDLPRGYDIESLFFRVFGTANVTTGGSAVRALAPTQLIKRVELVADGKNTICSVPFWKLCKNFGRAQTGYMLPPTAASVAAYSVEAFGVLDQALIDGIRPKDSNLRTSGMSLLQLRVTTGACTDLFTGSPAGSMTAFNLSISTDETVELPDDKGVISTPMYLQKRSYQDISLGATNANQQIVLPIGNALRGVEILTTINGEPSNAVLNALQLASGLDVRLNLPAIDLQRMNSVDYTPIGLLSNSATTQSSSLFDTGFYIADLMKNGPGDVNVTNAWDLSKASEAKLVVDVNGGAGYAMTIITTEFIQ
jgi:hypothetical protein